MYPIIDAVKTGNRIKRIMKSKGLSAKDVQEALNLASIQAVYYWINGRNLPSLENIYALSDLFNVPIDLIVVGNRKSRYIKELDSLYKRVYAYYERLGEKVA